MSKVKDFIEDMRYISREKIVMGIKIGVSIMFVGILFFVLFVYDEEEIADGDEIENYDFFSELSRELYTEAGHVDVVVDVLMEDPFVDNDSLESQVSRYVDVEKGRQQFHRLEVNLYAREIAYEMGHRPLVEVSYYHEDGWYESTQRSFGWFESIFYRNYELVIDGRGMQEYGGIEPVVDEEYEVLSELYRYYALEGGRSFDRAAEVYVEEHYGTELERDVRIELEDRYSGMLGNASLIRGLPNLTILEEEFEDYHEFDHERYMNSYYQ